jgi:Arc-like DNA binding domain
MALPVPAAICPVPTRPNYEWVSAQAPKGMRDALAESAERNGRSMSGELRMAVRSWLAAQGIELDATLRTDGKALR